MSRYLCIHAHFYQPPRENPWLEEVELQDSAYPHHDWNARITAECYAPNAASRILDAEGHILDIVNNYSRISFNFGPTLLSWMERHTPDVYASIIEANRLSKERFGGHGSALAQVYNHIIMPLANTRDKKTQIVWGIRDYTYRYGSKPEGIWLAETAVDVETLDLCVDQGIKFTILAPRQCKNVRKIGEKTWIDVSGDRIDPKRAYRCLLPSGRSINLFFYDGPVSQELAFGDVLADGRRFADRLMTIYSDDPDAPQLAHIATDGETYGHHHRFGDMALAYCLYHVEEAKLAELTIYASYLEKHPPEYEVEIHDNSSWSCVHGVERWRSACGCNTGGRGDWNQFWRAPLRGAMDWLRDSLILVFEEHAGRYLKDPWAARDDFIDVVLDRSSQNLERFFGKHASRQLDYNDRVAVLRLMEMQRHAMLMYTSCGWFFDEISGLEAMQVVQYAARAMQLTRDIAAIDLEPAYLKILERAKPNIPQFENTAEVYNAYIKPAVLDLPRVAAHYAVSSLFTEDHPQTSEIFSYRVHNDVFDRLELGRQKLAIGRISLQSTITCEKETLHFVVLHLGEQNLLGSVSREMLDGTFDDAREKIKEAFNRGNLAEVIALSDTHFGPHSYSLWHLFKDEQRRIVQQILHDMLGEVELQYRQTYQRHLPIMQAISEMHFPIPRILTTTAAFVINTDMSRILQAQPIDLDRLAQLTAEAQRWGVELDRTTLGFDASGQCNRIVGLLEETPYDIQLLEMTERLLGALRQLPLELNVWQAQNRFFKLSRTIYPQMVESAEAGHGHARRWIDLFQKIGNLLQVRLG